MFRKQIGWLVAQAFVLTGRRAAICRRCRREGLVVPVLMHGPRPERLAAILVELDRLVGLDRIELTFDDGRKVLNDCVPVLEKFGMKAVFFISPGEILRGYNWAETEVGGELSFAELCRMSEAERVAVFEAAGIRSGDRDELLSVDDICALSKHPLIEFGNHTWSHLSCSSRPESEVLEEVDRAQAQIEAWTGRRPTKFSYPFGHETPSLDAEIRARGLVPYGLSSGLVTESTRGRARNMAYEELSVAENVGRLLTAWPKVKRMPGGGA